MHTLAERLPDFSVEAYRSMLTALGSREYSLQPVFLMRQPNERPVVFLRHDVDFSPILVLPIAEAEAELGVFSTYFFLLTGHYNMRQAENHAVARRLIALGHEVGLHYDLEAFPSDFHLAIDELRNQVAGLARLCGEPVQSIVMHQPHRGRGDVFMGIDDLTHPHDPRWQHDLVYVSDSCRAWRDETLSACFSEQPPIRVLLNTHPELYLAGDVRSRLTYLETVLTPRVLATHREYLERTVAAIWLTHDGACLHDQRMSAREGAGRSDQLAEE